MSGFIKNIGGTHVMRFARPGYDASNMSLPSNRVAFDSRFTTHNIYTSFMWTGNTSDLSNLVTINTFPSLGYIPIAVNYLVRTGADPGLHTAYATASIGTVEVSITENSVLARLNQGFSGFDLSLYTIVFRTPAIG